MDLPVLAYILLGLSGFVIVATAISMAPGEDWQIRMFDFPRLQLMVLGVFCLSAWFVAGYEMTTVSVTVLVLLGLALLYQAYTVIPYTPITPRQVVDAENAEADSTFSLMISNIRVSNREAKRFLRVAQDVDADVLLVLEPNNWWTEQLEELDAVYPNVLKQPQENAYGLILYSRLPLEDPQIRYLIENDVPSIKAGLQLPSGDVIDFYGLHPKPPQPGSDSGERDAELLVVGREIADSERPAVVGGDLNDVAWSHTTKLFQNVSGLLDPRIGRGMFNTYHAQIPVLRYSLDHIFFSSEFELVELKRLPKIGSDHFPIYTKLHLSATAPMKQDEPEANGADEREAQKKIEKGAQSGDA